MITLPDLPADVAYASPLSRTCPACGEAKQSRQTLCRPHYFKLPRPMRDALYLRIGQGYEQSLVEALNFLQVEKIHLPPVPTHIPECRCAQCLLKEPS